MGKIMNIYKNDSIMTFDEFLDTVPKDYDGLIFKEIRKDPIGRSGSNPTWVEIYTYQNGEISEQNRIGLYKEYDFDYPNAAISEKIWSILGKTMLDTCRVPDIDIIKGTYGPEIVSYRIMDNNYEDLTNLMSIAYNKFTREELKMLKGHMYIEDILDFIRIEVKDDNNFDILKKGILETIILDSISNNADRHLDNWALIRDKNSNTYSLGLFDHSSSFVGIDPSEINYLKGWTSSYLKTEPPECWNKRQFLIGDMGETIIKYIHKKYPEYLKEFSDKINSRINIFFDELDDEKDIDNGLKKRIKTNFAIKIASMKKLLDEHQGIGGRGE